MAAEIRSHEEFLLAVEAFITKQQSILKQENMRCTLENILSFTNNFSHENLIWEGALGKVYKGQLFLHGTLMNLVIQRKHADLEHSIAPNESTSSNNLKLMELLEIP
ncbi:hypothetical protein L1987_37345 [Smallanthus sonchifolius]|uniref:Uncharacterized protein n=1 Tax=Smallanthus sonchifolius TaxID=185202 RepID=A0ACB9HHG8_9ASTR|nr:hypothetical protein L1987_37345 [Smallanthus sonchifolius]